MNVTVDGNTLAKGIETVANLSKIASNLTENHKPQPPKPALPERKPDTTNQPHTQTVEVKIGDPGNQNQQKPPREKPQPVIPPTKMFPDGRELSERECDVAKIQIANDQEYRMAEMKYRMAAEERNREERREREEYERKERERKREEEKRRNKRRFILGGFMAAAFVGLTGYACYTDYRNSQNAKLSLPASKNVKSKPIKVEGSVK